MEILTLFISLRCTQSCEHCVFGCSPDHGEHMSWDVFKQSLAIAKGNNIPKLNFFGGEPLVNPQIFSMMKAALETGFDLILATNCRLMEKEKIFAEFLDVTRQYKEHLVVITSKDRFHSKFFDPTSIVWRLRSEDYKVVVSDWSDRSVLLSDYNVDNKQLLELDTNYSCCNNTWMDYLGVLPDGGWQICPPYLEPFGDIFSNSFEEIRSFRNGLSLNYREGCTKCMPRLKQIHKKWESLKAAQSTKG